MKSPAFQFYPNDFLGSGSVAAMTLEEVGAYVLLLCYEWNEGGLPDDMDRLARWCRVSRRKFDGIWREISESFTRGDDGRWRNSRLELEREKQEEYRAKMAANGRRGGRPKKPQVIQEEPAANQKVSRKKADRKPIESTPSPTPSPTPVTTSPTGGAADAAGDDESGNDTGSERVPSNWVSLFGDDWSSATGGQPAFGKLGAHCKGIVQRYGIAVARPAWQTFCASPERRYGAAYFAEHFGDYTVRPPKLIGAGGNEAEVLDWLSRQSA